MELAEVRIIFLRENKHLVKSLFDLHKGWNSNKYKHSILLNP